MKKQPNKSGERNERILLDIVEQYIETAEPVSSQQLLGVYKYDLSSATLRNVMAQLDEAGYLIQPHVSAGRIPTAKAYRFYVDKVQLGAQRAPKQKADRQDEIDLKPNLRGSSDEVARALSQYLADATHSMAFAGILGINHFYREGLRYLLDEPEFLTTDNIRELVEYADSLESRLGSLYSSIQNDINVFIGEEQEFLQKNPFSLMVFSSKLPNKHNAVFGILGPMRMPYTRNMELLNEIKDLFK